METPRKTTGVSPIQPQRKYTEEEKRQLLINLELEGMRYPVSLR